MGIVSLIQGFTELSSFDLSASVIINGEKVPIYQIEYFGVQHFMMEPLIVAAVGERAHAATDELGTISVEVCTCTCVETIPHGDFGPPKVIGSYRKFNESVADFVSHETVFGQVERDEASPLCVCEQLHLIQTFKFIYLSKEILERRLSIEELEKLRQNNRALQLEQERLKEKVLKMQIKLLEDKLSKIKVQVVASSDSDSEGDGDAET